MRMRLSGLAVALIGCAAAIGCVSTGYHQDVSMGTPAPATTKQAAVEILKLPDPSPPVPQPGTGEKAVFEAPLVAVRLVIRSTRVVPREEEGAKVDPLGECVEERDPVWRRNLRQERDPHRLTREATSRFVTQGRRMSRGSRRRAWSR